MRDFLDFIQPSGTGYVEIRSIREGRVRQWWDTDRQAAVDLALAQSDEGWDAYYGVLPRVARSGKADDVAAMSHVLWADLDAKGVSKQAVLMRLVRYSMPPSVVVDSGHGYHAYWRLLDSVEWDTARLTMEGIAEELGGDHVYDKPRILRIPGTQNWKDGTPLPVRAVVFDTTNVRPIADYYRQLEIATDKHRPVVSHPVPYIPPAQRDDLPDWLDDIIRNGAPQGQRSEAAFKVMCQLAKRGWSDDEIRGAFDGGQIGEKMRQMRGGDRWFRRSLENARKAL